MFYYDQSPNISTELVLRFGISGQSIQYLRRFGILNQESIFYECNHLNYKIKSSFVIFGSAHNINEIRLKEKQNVSFIFISSIFKKNKNYLGIYRFKKLQELTDKKVIALGGISEKNKKKIELLSCYGFSGISYFE